MERFGTGTKFEMKVAGKINHHLLFFLFYDKFIIDVFKAETVKSETFESALWKGLKRKQLALGGGSMIQISFAKTQRKRTVKK